MEAPAGDQIGGASAGTGRIIFQKNPDDRRSELPVHELKLTDLREERYRLEMVDDGHGNPLVSLVVPIYNEEELIARLHAEVEAILDRAGFPWEAIYVDDGSTDRSLQLLSEVADRDPRVA